MTGATAGVLACILQAAAFAKFNRAAEKPALRGSDFSRDALAHAPRQRVATGEMTAAQSAAISIARISPMRTPTLPSPHHQRLLGAAMLWLLGGGALLLTTLVPPHTDLLGWTPAFWLIGAPLVVLLALEPALPRQLLALCRLRRREPRAAIWH
jgi:hypothetical protein